MRKRKQLVLWLLLFAAAVLLNLAAWNSTPFCDWFIKHLFPISVNTYGRLTSLVPFSVGEWMIAFGILLVLEAFILGVIRIFVRRDWVKRLFGYYCTGFAWVLLLVFWLLTFNCFVLYHASGFDAKYMPDQVDKTYSKQELAIVRDYVVEQLNRLSEEMDRGPEGLIAYESDVDEEAKQCMSNLGMQYPQLSGFYPNPKTIHSSDFLSQTHMMGYYFPFSMEANYNKTMYVINKPATACHELAHLKGFIYEDEANFIGYLACIESDDPFFQYSGYMSVINYIDRDFKASVSKNTYLQHTAISDMVYRDDIFLTKESWEKVEKKAVIDTAVVKKASNQFTEASLKINGVEDGMKSYNRVVCLLLKYYDGILY